MASELSSAPYCIKYLLFVFSFIFWLLGVCVFAIGIWIRVDYTIQHVVEQIEFEYYYQASYIVIVAGCIVMLVGFLGCIGSLRERPGMLTAYFILLFIIFVLELAAAAYVFSIGLEGTSLDAFVKRTLERGIDRYGYDPKARKMMDTIQANLYCCGVQNWIDYQNMNKVIPDSCRSEITGRQFEIGCYEHVVEFIEERTAIIGGVSITICFLEVFGMIFSLYLCMAIKKSNEKDRR